MSPDAQSLARQLRLFTTDPLVGAGLPLWLPDGAVVRAELERLVAEESVASGCQRVYTPVLAKRELFERSGHWAKFHDDMFPTMRVGGDELVLRPANCPHHVLVYAAEQRSFRDLPLRLAELGAMFRSELSGVLAGLTRVRQINLDDCHVFCTPDQVADEIELALHSVLRCYDLLGLRISRFRLSRRDDGPGYLGDEAWWRRGESQLAEALERLDLAFDEAPGEAAFYGPKVDVQVVDRNGREETLSTVQLDVNQPERFDLHYIGPDGGRHRPVMIHRGILSAMERLVDTLVEQYAGALPAWLSPVQALVLPVAPAQEDYAAGVHDMMSRLGLRSRVAGADDTVGARIRRAHEHRVPFVVLCGAREVADESVTVRDRDGGQQTLPTEQAVRAIAELVRSRSRGLELGQAVRLSGAGFSGS